MVFPDDVFREVLSYLWPVDVSRFARTSKRSLRIADMVLYRRNHIASVNHLASFCQALTSRASAAHALNMVSIDIREHTRFPIPAIAAALLASPNLTHLAVSLVPPRDPKYYIDPTPLLYASSPTLRELALTTHVPTAALTEFLISHPNLVSLSLPNQSPESMVELGAECVPRLTSITAPPALVACLVPERPVVHAVISRPVPREFMADVIESLAASKGPLLSLGLETEQPATHIGFVDRLAGDPCLAKKSAVTPLRFPLYSIGELYSFAIATPAVDHTILEDELQVGREQDDDEATWEPARELPWCAVYGGSTANSSSSSPRLNRKPIGSSNLKVCVRPDDAVVRAADSLNPIRRTTMDEQLDYARIELEDDADAEVFFFVASKVGDEDGEAQSVQ
ncbi:hypothetical protein RHS01_00728 [Rhizoctonia solani]|uniref:F-box domain-containing protein n=1 Tax=Rhizoctonia solani TaxID=456999 RepID=A0A8H7MAD5_9AGAM|nr:hypothetical protein RHS01_00728 [Rhizoctonia solani]